MKDVKLNRVPHIILLYWIIKVASTTLGETAADMFSMTFNLGYATTILIFMALFFIALGVKIYQKRYEPIAYWSLFTMTAIVGTAISDFIDRTLQLGYAYGSLILVSLLLVILAVWYVKERSISVEKITTRGAELYYWLAFLVANTLGTAAGDYLSDDLEFGFLKSALIISAVLLVTALCHFYTRISGIILFWVAFVLTRPFGATFGDLLTKPRTAGGLDFGTIGSSVFFAVVLVIALAREVKAEKARQVDELYI